jgi:hypothetical protein
MATLTFFLALGLKMGNPGKRADFRSATAFFLANHNSSKVLFYPINGRFHIDVAF